MGESDMAPVLKELTDERKISKQAVRISCTCAAIKRSTSAVGNPTEGSDPPWGAKKGILEFLTQMLHFVR